MRLLRKLLLACSCAMPLSACQGAPLPDDASDAEKQAVIETMYKDYEKDFPDLPDITAKEAAKLRDSDDAVLVDVRTPKEQAVSRIPGAITQKQFESDQEKFKERPVITYCTIGARSGAYARELRDDGWDVQNLRGSILAWTHAQQPLVDKDGKPTKRLHVYGPTWNLAADGYEAVW